jgi:hypothetical protein
VTINILSNRHFSRIRGAADSTRKMLFGKAFAMLAAHGFLCLAGELCAALTEIGWRGQRRENRPRF